MQAPFAQLRTVVRWRDLTPMRRRDGLLECAHPLPWLAASWIAAALAVWPVAIVCTFMFFLTALRLNHEAIHGNLGFRPRTDRRVLHALSAVMLGSNSAVAFNHVRHHRYLGTPDDLEGACGRMRLWAVIRHGPCFPIEMHRAAWRDGDAALRRRMTIDFGLNAAVVGAAVASWSPVLLYHVAAMSVAQCLTAFFAVWVTHHDCAPDDVARTQRSAILNYISYNMFLHREHHLFPGVPVRRLGILAARIAEAVPDMERRAALVVPEPRFRGRVRAMPS
ncbi:fatty acid desaturase [Sphingomonas sp. H39-1-10]|uniref:fatty acid desaturase n=1 Tax=Sphingomonas pollutisoli TaxID=3030829 RepID=UPI0023B9049D|nr:fatty acid desaturase [Sphingomonas pollutisoli]MDF0488568.1 fatty acid desaturase [Sphingomonas pollutisoli]